MQLLTFFSQITCHMSLTPYNLVTATAFASLLHFLVPTLYSPPTHILSRSLPHSLHCRRAQVQPGKKVAILGAGPIGLITAIVAAAFGADAIAITDISTTKLGFASQHCPRVQPLLINPKHSPAGVAEQLLQQCFEGSAPEVVIDCAGFQQTLETGLRAVGAGGKVVLVGMGQEHMSIPATLLTVKEVDLLGSFR